MRLEHIHVPSDAQDSRLCAFKTQGYALDWPWPTRHSVPRVQSGLWRSVRKAELHVFVPGRQATLAGDLIDLLGKLFDPRPHGAGH